MCYLIIFSSGTGSSVGIVTDYGPDGPGIESRCGGAKFSARPDRTWGPPSLLYKGYGVFLGGKKRPERDTDHSPLSSASVMEEWSYTSTHPLGHNRACNGNTYFFYNFSTAQKPLVGQGLLIGKVSRSHSFRHNILSRTILGKWSARHRDLYLTTEYTHKRETFMSPLGFESAIPANEWL